MIDFVVSLRSFVFEFSAIAIPTQMYFIIFAKYCVKI